MTTESHKKKSSKAKNEKKAARDRERYLKRKALREANEPVGYPAVPEEPVGTVPASPWETPAPVLKASNTETPVPTEESEAVKSWEESYSRLESDKKALEEVNASLRKSIDAKDSEIGRLKEALEISDGRDEIEKAEKETLKKAKETLEGSVSRLESELSGANLRNENLSRDLREAQSKFKTVADDYDTLKEAVERLRDDIAGKALVSGIGWAVAIIAIAYSVMK